MTDFVKHLRIDSAKNPRFRSARRLRERKERTRQGRFLIDGIREILRALDPSGPLVQIVEAYVAVELATTPDALVLLDALAERRVPRYDVPSTLWSRLAFGDRHDGIVVVAEYPASLPESVDLGATPLVIVLDQLEKPGNIGAVIRTVDAVGAQCLLLADGNHDRFNPNTIRASVGTVFSVPILQMSSRQALDWLCRRGLQVLVARPDAAASCFEMDFRGPTGIVFGSEAHGVSSTWNSSVSSGFRVPMLGHADSLNVSVTAAVVLYEALRQRGPCAGGPSR